jgi:hypothetical protein
MNSRFLQYFKIYRPLRNPNISLTSRVIRRSNLSFYPDIPVTSTGKNDSSSLKVIGNV